MRTFLCVVQCCCNSAASPSPCTMPSSSCRISVSLCSFESIPNVCPVPLAQLSTLPSRPAAQPICCAVLLRVCVLVLSARLKQEQLAAGHSRTSRTHKQMTATLRWRETKAGWRLEKRKARSEGAMNPGMWQGTGKWRGDCSKSKRRFGKRCQLMRCVCMAGIGFISVGNTCSQAQFAAPAGSRYRGATRTRWLGAVKQDLHEHIGRLLAHQRSSHDSSEPVDGWRRTGTIHHGNSSCRACQQPSGRGAGAQQALPLLPQLQHRSVRLHLLLQAGRRCRLQERVVHAMRRGVQVVLPIGGFLLTAAARAVVPAAATAAAAAAAQAASNCLLQLPAQLR